MSNIFAPTAVSGGNISSDGGFPIIARGLVWSTLQNPTITTNQGITNDGTGTGSFTSNLTGLIVNNLYYYRAYATNSIGTSYGAEYSFTANTIPTNGLVAYYPFTGNANDESGNDNNGTVNGATLATDRKGIENKAYNFDGINDYIEIADNNNLELTNNFSFSIWLNVGNVQTTRLYMIFTKHKAYDASSGTYTFSLSNFSSSLYYNFQATPNFSTNQISSILYQSNIWVNIVVTYDKLQNQLKYYKNGVLTDTKTVTFNIQNTNYKFYFGCELSQSNTLQNFYSGKLDDVRFYNRVLSLSEIQQLYNE